MWKEKVNYNIRFLFLRLENTGPLCRTVEQKTYQQLVDITLNR